ncbi:uncharacterized protein LOC110832843 isoform X2 [Zootermopsis nevadensis]|uniref:uncharacterized protein LOC110832843 isoform X2 n=1 Tax=Zootermopsis nevadensis TaxID=136037 RepID=UPI000B8E8C76|nr:uncharacterized protein LOC110832843 isoform X2 [Zootermopsis nevadensis]
MFCSARKEQQKMATWTSSMDVLADLDMLAEFSAGCNYAKDIPIVSYGRGSLIKEESSRPPSPLFNMVGEADLQLPSSLDLGVGRGERILARNQHRWDASLQDQIRMAMGPGYSNKIIEDFIRGESPNDHSNVVAQFDDAEEENSCHEATDDDATNTKGTLSSAAKPEKAESSDSDPPANRLIPKKPLGRCRNALLNSLANFSTGSVTEFDNKNEINSSSPIQVHNSSCNQALTHTYPISDHFKNKTKESFPIQIGGINRDVITMPISRADVGYKFREEDFPPL